MENEKWLNQLEEELRDYAEPLPSMGWARLEKDLAGQEGKETPSKRTIWLSPWRMAAAAAVLVAVSVWAFRTLGHSQVNMPVPEDIALVSDSISAPEFTFGDIISVAEHIGHQKQARHRTAVRTLSHRKAAQAPVIVDDEVEETSDKEIKFTPIETRKSAAGTASQQDESQNARTQTRPTVAPPSMSSSFMSGRRVVATPASNTEENGNVAEPSEQAQETPASKPKAKLVEQNGQKVIVIGGSESGE